METTTAPETKKDGPFYFKATIILFGLILFFYTLNVLEEILVPVAFALLISILLNPLNNRLESKLPKTLSILITLTLMISVVGGIFYFLSTQIATFSESIPALQAKSVALISQLQLWFFQHFGVSIDKQVAMAKQALEGGQVYVGQTLSTLLGLTSVLILIPIYIFFLLYYKPLILDFLFHVFSEKNSLRVAEILAETKTSVQSYVIGLLIETLIVSAMNSAALLILGVRSAILIGVIGGILNMIPYLGGLVAIGIPILMATVTHDGYTIQLAILGAYLVIQFIDNNILMTRIVSSKVQINSLISIIIVLMGGALWGLSGMFLSIPFVAILKIIFDRVDGLKPWGRLLGDKIPEIHAGVEFQERWNRIFRRLGKKKAEQAQESAVESGN
ncbi:MAG: AI-2E family transporter [Taibaiella sp.]|nr:AI-2E family transporter [Taibaiella sp.]